MGAEFEELRASMWLQLLHALNWVSENKRACITAKKIKKAGGVKYPCACGSILSTLQNAYLVGIYNLESAMLSLPSPLECPLALEKGPKNWKTFQNMALDIHSRAHTTTKYGFLAWVIQWFQPCCCFVTKLYLFCGCMDCSPPGSSVHGISQAGILEWVSISFSRGSYRPRDQTCTFCIGRQTLYRWVTREAWFQPYTAVKWNTLCEL